MVYQGMAIAIYVIMKWAKYKITIWRVRQKNMSIQKFYNTSSNYVLSAYSKRFLSAVINRINKNKNARLDEDIFLFIYTISKFI